jgi:hypothetical protein
LILPGKREVETPILIEASTGKRICEVEYYKVECVWNNVNWWVNKMEEDLTKDLLWDFSNKEIWEQLIPEVEEVS